MLLEDLGLTDGSTVKVDLECDYCGVYFTKEWRSRVKTNKNNDKDACKNCISKKRKETCIKKYGVENVAKTSDSRKKTSLSKGGNGKSVLEYKEEIIDIYNTNPNFSVNKLSKKFGLTRSVLISAMREWGLDTSKNSVEKRIETTKEKYGVDHILQSEEGKKKYKQTLKERYGSENPYDNEEYKKRVIEKSKKTCIKKYGIPVVLHDPKRQKEFDKKRIKHIYNDKTIREIAEAIGIHPCRLYGRIREWGLEKAISRKKHFSFLESIIQDFFESKKITYQSQVKIGNFVADFVVDDIVIECDGLYWHSESKLDKNYHKLKRDEYIKSGYNPLFFREDELRDKFPIVCSIILNKLNKSKKYYARKLTISELNTKESNLFFNKNHLMESGRGQTFVLKDEEVLCALRVCNRGNGIYEISRFCNKLNCSVVGGFSRLVKYAEKVLNPSEIITFIDNRYGVGDYLTGLGFKFVRCGLSFKWTDYNNTYHRMKYPGNSGYNINLDRIWDCGQSKFSK